MYSKAQIWNLALGALLLDKQIIDVAGDASKEARVLRTHWDMSYRKALEDLDLDATSTTATLELIETFSTGLWKYAYKYPSDCSFFRRITSGYLADNRYSKVPKQVRTLSGVKVILTNQETAVAEYISHNVSIDTLSASAGYAVAISLAMHCAPLIVGKGAKELRKSLNDQYVIAKAEAQEHDSLENSNYEDEVMTSEFVAERLS